MKILRDGQVAIFPPREGACWICGDIHSSRDPHNAGSLLYQHRFRKRNGRYPTWADAMNHCSRKVKERWVRRLREKGIRVFLETEKSISEAESGRTKARSEEELNRESDGGLNEDGKLGMDRRAGPDADGR